MNDVLYDEFVSFPANSHGDAARFRGIAGMPCIFGCIDGSHIPIVTPEENENQFINRHGYHSINGLFVCGADMSFYYCNAGWPGSVNDSRIFRNSSLQERLESSWRPFDGAVLLGDSGFTNSEYMITPILVPRSEQDMSFNVAHKKTRRIIESSFGLLKERFRCLKSGLPFEPIMASKVISCCVCLHNIVKKDLIDVRLLPSQAIENSDPSHELAELPAVSTNRRNQLVALF